MVKTFTVHSVYSREISPGKGSIVWLLSDEKGKPRKVSAVTGLDKEGVINDLHAVYSREVPLVEALRDRSKGDVFQVDFRGFNAREGYQPRETYGNMRRQESASGLSSRVSRVLVAVGVLTLLWFAWVVVTDVGDMAVNFPSGSGQ